MRLKHSSIMKQVPHIDSVCMRDYLDSERMHDGQNDYGEVDGGNSDPGEHPTGGRVPSTTDR